MSNESVELIKGLDIYAITTNSDRVEGRGHPVVIGRYTSKNDALAEAVGQGCMGSNAEVGLNIVNAVKIGSELFLIGEPIKTNSPKTKKYLSDKLQKDRENALRKLSPYEKNILGLKAE